MKADVLSLDQLGFNAFFASSLQEVDATHAIPARVISQHKNGYQVKCAEGEFVARITGKHMFKATVKADYPAVGDWVLIALLNGEQASIQTILPRQTIIKRSFGDKNRAGEKDDMQIIATNIDVGFVIESVDRDYNLNRLERYLAMLDDGGVRGAIIINKADLQTEAEQNQKSAELRSRFPHVDIIVTSTVTSHGLAAVEEYIQKGKTYCFLGSSGVGKSSLINALLGTNKIKTGDVSTYSDRGKHTTTGRQMYFLASGGIVIDSPGIREVGMADVEVDDIHLFDDIAAIGGRCKYVNCTHVHEPGCAVLEATETGVIDKARYTNYISLKKESDYYDLSEQQKRKKNKDFGIYVAKAKKQLRDVGYDDFR